MKKLAVLLTAVILTLAGCGNTQAETLEATTNEESVGTASEASAGRERKETAADDSAEASAAAAADGQDENGGETGKDVEDGLTNQDLRDMAEVDDAVSALMQSDEYQALSYDEKSERAYALLLDLAQNGTQNAPYSLIVEKSILRTDDMISYEYRCGALGGIKLRPFDSQMN